MVYQQNDSVHVPGDKEYCTASVICVCTEFTQIQVHRCGHTCSSWTQGRGRWLLIIGLIHGKRNAMWLRCVFLTMFALVSDVSDSYIEKQQYNGWYNNLAHPSWGSAGTCQYSYLDLPCYCQLCFSQVFLWFVLYLPFFFAECFSRLLLQVFLIYHRRFFSSSEIGLDCGCGVGGSTSIRVLRVGCDSGGGVHTMWVYSGEFAGDYRQTTKSF